MYQRRRAGVTKHPFRCTICSTAYAPAPPSRPSCSSGLVERFLPLARSLAQPLQGRGESRSRISSQVANMGLVKAIKGFRP